MISILNILDHKFMKWVDKFHSLPSFSVSENGKLDYILNNSLSWHVSVIVFNPSHSNTSKAPNKLDITTDMWSNKTTPRYKKHTSLFRLSSCALCNKESFFSWKKLRKQCMQVPLPYTSRLRHQLYDGRFIHSSINNAVEYFKNYLALVDWC